MLGISGFFGLVLAVSNRYLRVEEDPRVEQVEGMLPGTNCGACGQPGCHAFAEVLAQASARVSQKATSLRNPDWQGAYFALPLHAAIAAACRD